MDVTTFCKAKASPAVTNPRAVVRRVGSSNQTETMPISKQDGRDQVDRLTGPEGDPRIPMPAEYEPGQPAGGTRASRIARTMNAREKRSFFAFSDVMPTSFTPRISTAPLGGTILIYLMRP